jgi:23S rRNA (adenine2503-C2)-methyltransferase
MNFEEVIDALWRIVDLLGISKRKITLSTAGIVPKLLLFPKNGPEINLAISLNATTDDVRNRIMPVNMRYPIQSLINACRKYPLSPGRRITFEYVMIGGMNDSLEDARRLVNLLSGIRCKVNLIPLNLFPHCELRRASDERILAFQKVLMQHKIRTLVRESRGKDIGAACGQLKAGYKNKGI